MLYIENATFIIFIFNAEISEQIHIYKAFTENSKYQFYG